MQHLLIEDTVVVFTWFEETLVMGALDDDFITLEVRKSNTGAISLYEKHGFKQIDIRKKYYDATHNCYSYVLSLNDGSSAIKASDDGEPSQTAGVVILDVLQKNELTNVLAVVTRYFGGIKLGAGGLVRAYSDATLKALENSIQIEKDLGLIVKFTVQYADVDKIKYYIKIIPVFKGFFRKNPWIFKLF